MLSLLIGIALGVVNGFNEIKKNNEIEHAYNQAILEERERLKFELSETLNRLEFELDLLQRIEDAQSIDLTKPCTERTLKKVYTVQKQIRTLLLQKEKIENKLREL